MALLDIVSPSGDPSIVCAEYVPQTVTTYVDIVGDEYEIIEIMAAPTYFAYAG